MNEDPLRAPRGIFHGAMIRDSGNQPGGIKERLERLGLWDDLTRNLGAWP